MANEIKLKRGSGSDPSASDLVVGEIAIRTDTGKLFTKKDDNSVAEISGGGISDGDKGDITVSSSGSVFTIDNDAVTYAKIQNVSATDRILGRDSSGAGVIEEITPANLRTMINVEDGATADQTKADIDSLGIAASSANTLTIGNHNTDSSFQIVFSTNGAGDARTLGVDGISNAFSYNPSSNTLDLENLSVSDITVTSASPTISLVDSNADSDFNLHVNGGIFSIRDQTNINASRLSIDSSGNVGIGTTGPTDLLTLDHATSPFVTLKDSGTIKVGIGADSGLSYVFSQDGNPLVFSTSDQSAFTERMRLTTSGNLQIANDTGKIELGASQDLKIYHDGDNSFIKDSGTGRLSILTSQLRVNNAADSEIMISATQDDSVELYHNGTKRLETTAGGSKVTGNFISTGDILIDSDSNKLKLGLGEDLQLFHDGSNSFIDETGTGGLILRSGDIYLRNPSNADMIHCQSGGYVKLYCAGTERLETTSLGIDVTGTRSSFTSNNSANYTLELTNQAAGFGLHVEVNDDSSSKFGFLLRSTNDSQDKAGIKMNGGFVSRVDDYASFSDVKLKENIVDAKSQWNDIKAVKLRNFNLKNKSDQKLLGVIAQELESICPSLVENIPDVERDEETGEFKETGTVTKTVKTSVLRMKGLGALQEAMIRIEALEAKVIALEG